MTRRRWLVLAGVAVALAAAIATRLPGPRPSGQVAQEAAAPRLWPALDGVVLPPNIAPPGLRIDEPGTAWHVLVKGERGAAVQASGTRPGLSLPLRGWRRLLAANAGGQLALVVSARRAAGGWTRYAPVALSVAREPIDRYLVYRMLPPAYSLVSDTGIYERDLTSYRQRLVVHGRQVNGCVNCHTFWQGSGRRFTLGTRSDTWGNRTLLANGGKVVSLAQPVGFGTWHPDGKMVTFSANKVVQFFHTAGNETREVMDMHGALACFDIAQQRFVSSPELSQPEYLNSYPCWAPDGRTLYFVRARRPWGPGEPYPPKQYDQVRYDLARISYDPATSTWGHVETLRSGRAAGRSFVFPRVSPDGRWLLYTSCEFGCFPAFKASADLGLIDLRTGRDQPVEVNSDRSESWHTWSRNGRWVVFSSKRADGLLTKLYLAYFDADGRMHPPLLLPQRRADYYDRLYHNYNVPELVESPVAASAGQLGRAGREPTQVKAKLPDGVGPAAVTAQ
ncbi:MAG: PD40 domain-containing protein [Armatimonadetes bacterium]|nr:PD40 domain-containing protein [Armatimonadota bacterium]